MCICSVRPVHGVTGACQCVSGFITPNHTLSRFLLTISQYRPFNFRFNFPVIIYTAISFCSFLRGMKIILVIIQTQRLSRRHYYLYTFNEWESMNA